MNVPPALPVAVLLLSAVRGAGGVRLTIWPFRGRGVLVVAVPGQIALASAFARRLWRVFLAWASR